MTQTWQERKPGGGVKRLRGNCTRNKQAALTAAAESVTDHHQRWQRRQDGARRDRGRLRVTRRAASAAERAAARVRWLSEVGGRNSHVAAGRKHYGKLDELVLSNPCRDARSRPRPRSLSGSFAPFPKRSLGGVLPRIRALFISASATLLNL